MGETVLAVIGARLNSSRLPGKHLLPLAGKPLIERIVNRLEQVKDIDAIVLATTSDDYNEPLYSWGVSHDIDCLAYEGDVNDLIGRVDAAVQKHDPGLILYICGDCPLIEPDTIQLMIEGWRRNPNADTARLTAQLPEASGTIHEGFDFYSRQLWDKIVSASTEPFEREHIGAALHHSKKVEINEIAWVEDDPVFSSLKHRLSVDTKADYDFMSLVYDAWYEEHEPETIVSLKWVISQLLKDERWAHVNAHVRQKQVTEAGLKVRAVVASGAKVGRGHATRTIVLLQAFQELFSADVSLLILAESAVETDTGTVRSETIALDDMTPEVVSDFVRGADIFLIDVPAWLELKWGLEKLRSFTVTMDHTEKGITEDMVFASSFFAGDTGHGHTLSGWSNYLIPKVDRRAPVKGHPVGRLIIITGSNYSDVDMTTLVKQVKAVTTQEHHIVWVTSHEKTILNMKPEGHDWQVWKNIPNLAMSLVEFDLAITAYGVSFFECLNAGLPTVVFKGAADVNGAEWLALSKEMVALLSNDVSEVGKQIQIMLDDDGLRQKFQDRAYELLPNDGGRAAASAIFDQYNEFEGTR